ncbi:MAG: zinc ribbon domain-containing protein [Clostridia bacterium]|nr:zinc ribbon domain-containing protein [Clostridia bacterium]
MKYCPDCGGILTDPNTKFCPHCGEQLIIPTEPERKHCPNCGRPMMGASRVCMGCGYTIGGADSRQGDGDYDHCVWNATVTNVIAAVLLGLGVLCGFVINIYLGAALCLVGEFVALIPNTKLQKEIKRNNANISRSFLRKQIKEIQSGLKGRYASFRLSRILGVVCLVTLVALFALYYYIGALA